MELLKQRILKDGRAINEDVLLVDSFLNHQIDVELMQEIGKEFARHFAEQGITKVVTIEASGIAPASFAALALQVPLVVMKKSVSAILSEDVMQTSVHSFTKGTNYMLTCKTRFISENDRILFIDDFLANGEAALGAIRLLQGNAKAKVCGIGIVIEKAFQPGRDRLAVAGFKPYALARVAHMERDLIEFAEEDE